MCPLETDIATYLSRTDDASVKSKVPGDGLIALFIGEQAYFNVLAFDILCNESKRGRRMGGCTPYLFIRCPIHVETALFESRVIFRTSSIVE